MSTPRSLDKKSDKISSGLAALIIFVFLLYLLDRSLYKLPSIYAIKQLDLASAKHVKVLILGSSHALFGISPGELQESAVNLAAPSQTPDLDEKLLLKVIK